MKIMIEMNPRKETDAKKWHGKFAWFPTRCSPRCIVWLEWYARRMEVVSEGNWAGGFQFRWHRYTRGETVFVTKVFGD